MLNKTKIGLLFILLGLSATASAHTGTEPVTNMFGAIAHFFTGLDHLLILSLAVVSWVALRRKVQILKFLKEALHRV